MIEEQEGKVEVHETPEVQAKDGTEQTEIDALRQELNQTKTQAAEYLDGWQRARADLSNAKRRFDKERSEAGQLANAMLIKKLLPVVDDMERALKNVPEGQDPSWVGGIGLIQRKLLSIFETEGIKPIEVKPGDKFDPSFHEAVTYEQSPDFKEGEIIAEVQKGYRMGDQVLRPALVRVGAA